MGLSRRRLLRAAPLGGAALAGGLAGRAAAGSGDGPAAGGGGDGGGDAYRGPGEVARAAARYHGAFAPPSGLGEGALDTLAIPPEPGGPGERDYDIAVTARHVEVAEGHVLDAWCYGGTVPGPVLRATEGDRLRVRVRNRTDHPHNLHLHGRHDPAMDGWEPIRPGGAFTYEVEAAPAGLHPYHCHSAPLAEHVARGLYGALIVDPPGGRAPAHERVLVLSGFDLDGDGRNELYAWNGVAGFYDTYPIKVPVGELVRLYVLNMVEYEAVASFHLHAQTFDLYRTGTRAEPDDHTDTVTLGQGERAVLELRLPALGRYMFHPHQHHMAGAGATGWLAAV